jgi:hypothetical protein
VRDESRRVSRISDCSCAIGTPGLAANFSDDFCERDTVALQVSSNSSTNQGGPCRFKEGYAKLSLKKYRPIAARNEDRKVFNGLL